MVGCSRAGEMAPLTNARTRAQRRQRVGSPSRPKSLTCPALVVSGSWAWGNLLANYSFPYSSSPLCFPHPASPFLLTTFSQSVCLSLSAPSPSSSLVCAIARSLDRCPLSFEARWGWVRVRLAPGGDVAAGWGCAESSRRLAVGHEGW